MYLSTLILGACGGIKKVTYENGGLTKITEGGYITVIGVATERLSRSGIIDDKGVFYLIKGVSQWSRNLYGKKVKARGKLMVIDRREWMKVDIYRQGPGILNLLKDTKWEVIE